MRRLSILAAGLALAACGGREVAPEPRLGLAEAKSLAAERSLPLLLDFFSET